MKTLFPRPCLLSILVLVCCLGPTAAPGAETWDLAGQWSNEQNPNGPWSYEGRPAGAAGEGETAVVATQSGDITVRNPLAFGLGKPTLAHVSRASWTGPDSDQDFPRGAQPAWQTSDTQPLPMLFRSTGVSAYDAPKGRVSGYAPFLFRWTAPRDMNVDVSGGAWMLRPLGRIQKMTLGKTAADSGDVEFLFYDIPVPFQSASFDSGNPFSFAHAAQFRNEGREHGTLNGIPLAAGDSLWLFVDGQKMADFVGVDFTIAESRPVVQKTTSTRPWLGERLFNIDRPTSEWVELNALGFDAPVTGVIYRRDTAAVNGLPLGGIDTGCIDLETSGLWGYCTIFNTHVPRRGPMNLPFLGLAVGDDTWVLCDPKQTKPGLGNFQPPFMFNIPHHVPFMEGQGLPVSERYVQNLNLEGVKTVDEIHYWGHYPVADIEYETTSPVSVGLRAWSPFIPGHIVESMVPGIVFEVHLRNTSDEPQTGSVAVSFPGPTALEGGGEIFQHSQLSGELQGVQVSSPNATYVLATSGAQTVRTGGELGADGSAWASINRRLPSVTPEASGASLAIDFKLDPSERRVVRAFLTWSAPYWKGGGKPWASSGRLYRHMYDSHYPNAAETARMLTREHSSLLRRVLAWQEVLYGDATTRGWLADALINAMYLIPETGMWAQAGSSLPSWVNKKDGLFGMNECPRTCPQIECVPCGFYGNLPLVYFFPELMLSTYRGYKNYTFENGAPPWVWGGWTAQKPPIDFSEPVKGYQWATNPISIAAMIDRYYLCWGDKEPDFVKEFYPMLKANMIYAMNLRTTPEYSPAQRILMMPDGDWGGEWFEAGEPGWYGMATHVGGLHLAQLRIVKRFADLVGDTHFAKECQDLLDGSMQALEENLWEGRFYLNCFDPLNGRKSEHVFGFQLDGEWIVNHHGLPGIFRKDRVQTTLETIKRCNMQLSKYGVVNYANPDGTAAAVGGYGPYSYFPPEVLMLSMNYMYEGRRDLGLQIARRLWENIVCRQRYAWDLPNIIRGDKDTGQRGYFNGGSDYYQDLIVWCLPAAINGTDLGALCKPGGLADRVTKAGAP